MRPLLHVPCASCGAQIGYPCTVKGGVLVAREPHEARQRADRALFTLVAMDERPLP